MTDSAIKEALILRFSTLNTFSGITFIKADNVALPNMPFTPPADNRWFALGYMPGAPEAVAIGVPELDRWSGVFQIDIYVPLDKGEAEADNKYGWIARLFARGTVFGGILITRAYSPTTFTEDNSYRKVVRIEWTANIDNREV